MTQVHSPYSATAQDAVPVSTSSPDRLRGYTLTELMQHREQIQWLVPGVLVHGSVGYVAGPFKSLKSGIALDLAITKALPSHPGLPPAFLNHFPCESLPHVLYFSGEARHAEIVSRIEAILTSKLQFYLNAGYLQQPLPLQEVASRLNLTTYFDTPRLSQAEEQRKVNEEIQRTSARLVILDPLYLSGIAGGTVSHSNLFEMGDLLRRMEETILGAGATPIFVHHFTKGIKIGSEPNLGDMAFAGSAERAGQWLLINHREPFDSTLGLAQLMMLVGGRAGQCGAYSVDVTEGCLNPDLSGRQWQVQVGHYQQGQGTRRQSTTRKLTPEDVL